MNFPRYKLWLVLGAVAGCLAVVLGAFGAHGLQMHLKKSVAADSSLSESERAAKVTRQLDNWETAARYQMYHALALLAVGLLAARRCGRAINLAGIAFTLGMLAFSGWLYATVLIGRPLLVLIVPSGGALLIVGWACLIVAVLKDPVAAGHNPQA